MNYNLPTKHCSTNGSRDMFAVPKTKNTERDCNTVQLNLKLAALPDFEGVFEFHVTSSIIIFKLHKTETVNERDQVLFVLYEKKKGLEADRICFSNLSDTNSYNT